MVKKNSNFKLRNSAKKTVEKKTRKIKSSFVPYDDSILFRNEDSTEDLVRTFLRDTRGSRSNSYYDDDSNLMW